jgi:hypothetical protein
MTPGEIKLAPCPACKSTISVEAPQCLKCGHPITPSTKSAMIQGVLAERERAAREAEESQARWAREWARRNEEIRDVEYANQTLAALRTRLMVQCRVCGHSQRGSTHHFHPEHGGWVTTQPSDEQRKLEVEFKALEEKIIRLGGVLCKKNPNHGYYHKSSGCNEFHLSLGDSTSRSPSGTGL